MPVTKEIIDEQLKRLEMSINGLLEKRSNTAGGN